MEYLDREGGKYLATKLKSYVDNKFTGGGTVDLTNYYTRKKQISYLLICLVVALVQKVTKVIQVLEFLLLNW